MALSGDLRSFGAARLVEHVVDNAEDELEEEEDDGDETELLMVALEVLRNS